MINKSKFYFIKWKIAIKYDENNLFSSINLFKVVIIYYFVQNQTFNQKFVFFILLMRNVRIHCEKALAKQKLIYVKLILSFSLNFDFFCRFFEFLFLK